MSSDETAKIETKIEPTLIVKDAPSIVGEPPAATEAKAESDPVTSEPAKSEATPTEVKSDAPTLEAVAEAPKVEMKPEMKAETPAAEAPKVEALEATSKLEDAKAESPKLEADTATKSEALTLAPEPQIEPVVIQFKKPEPAAAAAVETPRSTRFALLAASVAIAASFGAIGGSLGAAKLGLLPTPEPVAAVAPINKEQVAEEVRALKESLAQLRATTRALSEGFTTLRATVTNASMQNGKIAETLDRIEKAQAAAAKVALSAPAASAPPTIPAHMVSTTQALPQPPAPEVTGSIAPKGAPMVLGTLPSNLKPPAVQGFVLRRVYDGAALIEGRDGMIEVEPGVVVPGLGRIEAIKREDGRWVVVTARGIVR